MLWKEVRPQSRFRIRTNRPIAESEIRVISQLYVPIIQANAYSLYIYLYHQLIPDVWASEECTHRVLMDSLGLHLDQLMEAREKLEGIGLLSTYRIQEGEGFEYFLQPPLTPHEFFQSEVLSLFLLNRMGQSNYRKLRERYSSPRITRFDDLMQKEEITKDFSQVYKGIKLSEVTVNPESETERFMNEMELEHPIPVTVSNWENLRVPETSLDFDYLEALFPMEHRSILFSSENKGLMTKFTLLYGIGDEQLGTLLKDTYHFGTKKWDITRFETLVKLAYKVQTKDGSYKGEEKEINPSPINKEEHLKNLKAISPYQLIRNYQGGGDITTPDKELIDYLMEGLGLLPEVVNVLLDYVLLTNDNKLPRSYTEKVASSWKRKGFVTAEEAFAFAQSEYEKNIKGYKQTNKKVEKQVKKKVPEYIWLQVERDRKQESEQQQKVDERPQTEVDVDEVRKLILESKRERSK